MPNLKSSEKRMRQNQKRRAHKRAIRSRLRTVVKKANTLIEEGDREVAEKAVRDAVSELDRAVKKGILHRNNADRRKSRLMKRLNAVKE
ncbi:MAG: 30S ribosomal protein S20 [Anaerolineales bacterium]